ncbi:MAG: hypothetical protein KGJ06_04680 [Pseudomonadota bacterium]|nr:hypothetical protein [Pseudomonadota bacterium]
MDKSPTDKTLSPPKSGKESGAKHPMGETMDSSLDITAEHKPQPAMGKLVKTKPKLGILVRTKPRPKTKPKFNMARRNKWREDFKELAATVIEKNKLFLFCHEFEVKDGNGERQKFPERPKYFILRDGEGNVIDERLENALIQLERIRKIDERGNPSSGRDILLKLMRKEAQEQEEEKSGNNLSDQEPEITP